MKIANALIVLMLAAGCGPDPQAAELESQIKQLTAERDEAQADLAAAKGEANRLRRQLAAKERQRVEAVREASDLRDENADLRRAFGAAQQLAVGRYIELRRQYDLRHAVNVTAALNDDFGRLLELIGHGDLTRNEYTSIREAMVEACGDSLVMGLFPPDFTLRVDSRGFEEVDQYVGKLTGITPEDIRRNAERYRDADFDARALIQFETHAMTIDKPQEIFADVDEGLAAAKALGD